MKISRANNGRIKAYTYDSIGNIIRVNSSYPMPQYQLTERYSCDSADQLLTAESTCNNNVLCSGAYSYNNWGKINTYTQQTTDPATNMSENKDYRCYFPGSSADMAQGQTSFAPIIKYDMQQNPQPLETLTFGINGSLRKRTVQSLSPYTEYYLFNSAANLKAYSNNTLDFAYYGYNVSNTRTYKLSMLNQNQWINGQSQPLDLHIQHAMFYPNAYLNFNQNGDYTKHYYNGTERIASRLGDAQPESFVISSNDRLGFRIMQADQQARADLLELVEAGDVPIETPSVEITSLHPTNATSNIFYYHTNHLGSTAYVTDNNAIITQGFLYAPFGEITTEYAPMWQNGTLPKYSFNAKELDEETGMYYYEARYYKPPVFTSRDAMFEKKPWLSPYHYCSNNPVGKVDPSGMMDDWYQKGEEFFWSDDVVSQETTPEGCTYIGDDNALLKQFGFPVSNNTMATKQWVQTLVGTNVESNNPYEQKYYAFGNACAKATSTIDYTIQKNEETGKLDGIKINASLNTAVSDNRAGGKSSASLEVSCGNVKYSSSFRSKEESAYIPYDFYTREYKNASITIPADKLYANCVSKLQIIGPWFSQNQHMSVPFTLTVLPSYLKHNYLK